MQQLIQLIQDPFFKNSALYEIFVQDQDCQIQPQTNFQGFFQNCQIDIEVLQTIKKHYEEEDWEELSLYIEVCNKFMIKIPKFYEFCQESDVWALRNIINNFDLLNVRVENFLEIISFQKLVELQEIVEYIGQYNQYFTHLQNFKIIFIDSQTLINYYYPLFLQNKYDIIVAKNASIDLSVFYNQNKCKILIINNCNHLLNSPNFIYSYLNQELFQNLLHLSIQYDQTNIKNLKNLSYNLPYFDFHLFPNLISLNIDCCCVYFQPQANKQLKLQYLQIGKILKFKEKHQKQFKDIDIIKLQKSFAQNNEFEIAFILSAFIQKFANLQQIAISKFCFKNQDLSLQFHNIMKQIGAFSIVDYNNNNNKNKNFYFQNYVNYKQCQ